MNFNFYPNTKKKSIHNALKKCLVFILVVLSINYSYAQPATALHFDGVDDEVVIPASPSLNISTNITIETWIFPTQIGGTQDVICKSSNLINNGYVFPRTSDGWETVEFLLHINGSWQVLAVPYGFDKINEWHHLAATYDGFFMRVYIDGILAGSQATTGAITVNNNPLAIGGQPGFTDEYFQGKIDEARIWNRALSSCEIINNMNCELSGVQTGLSAYYKFNQGFLNSSNLAINQLTDASNNNNTGTLTGFSLIDEFSNWSDGIVTGNCSVFIPLTATAGSLQAVVPVGGTIHLTASGGGTYAWVGPNGFTSTAQNPSISGAGLNASGTYTVTVTNGSCSASASTTVTVSLPGSALTFDGHDNSITIPNSPSLNFTSTFSIETWVFPTSSTPQSQNVVSKSTSIVNNGYIFPRTDDGWRSFSFWLAVNGNWKILTAQFPALNQWSHVAATYDGFFMKIYLNGVLVGSQQAIGTVTTNTNDISLGRQEGQPEFYKGSTDELRIWSRALNQCEIQNNLTCELNGANNALATQTGLAAYYRFNQGLVNGNNAAFSTLADSSGHGNNGILQSFDLNGSLSNWTQGTVSSTCSAFAGLQNATITSNGILLEVGSTINLSASAGTSWSWTGPNGFTSTLQNVSIPNAQTNASGLYSVSVSSGGCTIVANINLTVASKAGTLDFDGVNDIVTVPASNSLNIANTITLESWVFPTNNNRLVQDVMCKSAQTNNSGYIFPRTDDGWNSFVFYLRINGSWEILSAPYAHLNEWHHLAATYDGFYMRIYMDGILKASKQIIGNIDLNSNSLFIGGQVGFPEYFAGKIEEARIWNRALSQCEIINNMNCELDPAARNGLAAYYKFNQGFLNTGNSGITTLADSSINGNNGILQNFALQGNSSNWTDPKVSGTCAVFSLPPVTAAANGSVFGIGSTIKLFAANGSTYTWDGPGSYISTQQNPVIINAQPAASGIYTVTSPYTNCVVTASLLLNVPALDPIQSSGPTTFCPSSSVTLSTANAGTAYQWYRNDILITGATGSSYIANQSGIYGVTVNTSHDIFVSSPITLTVADNLAPQPTIAVLPDVNLLTPGIVSVFPTAIDDCAGTLTGTTSAANLGTYNVPGTYTITWTYDDGNGNVSHQNQNIVVVDNIAPVLTLPANITLNGNVSICGAITGFTATATDNSGGPVTITYNPAQGSIFPIGNNTVTVTATDPSNNVTTGTFTVTVLQTIVAPVTGNTTICAGSATTLATVSSVTGGVWSSDNNTVASVNASGLVTGLSAGTATITFTNNCGATASATVTVNPLPIATITASGVTTFCAGGSVVLTSGSATGNLWSTGETTQSITVNTSGSYTVTVSSNGCSTISSAVAVTVNPLPVATISAGSATTFCAGGSVVLTSGSANGNLWSTGETTQSITVNTSGTPKITAC